MDNIEDKIKKNKIAIVFIMYFLFILLSLISNIFVVYIIIESSDNPLKKEKEFDKYLYFSDEINCKCEKIIFLEICSNEQLLSGCINIDKNNTSIKLNENLDDCKKIENSIMSQNLTLSDIFDLNTNSIHSTSISLLIVNSFIFLIGCFFFVQMRK